MSERPRLGRVATFASIALVLAALAATSSPRRIGDGPEYLAMALQLSALHRPSLSEAEVANVLAYYRALGGNFGIFVESFQSSELVGADRRRDFAHFWFYPALAAPGVALARAFGLHPNVGFVATNIALYVLALAVVAPWLGWAASCLLFFGPVLWWIDKAHTELFTFSLLAIGLALVEDAPWWSMMAFGAAATQNLPIAVAIPLVGVAALWRRPELRRDRRVWLGAVAALAVTASHPLYYLVRLGVPEPQALVSGVVVHVPRPTEIGAFVWDPNIGILPNFPALGPIVCASFVLVLVRRGRHAFAPGMVVALALGAFFVTSFAQTTNVNSGGTPGPARYGLWLIPLAIPVLREAERHGGRVWRRVLAASAVASAVWSLVVYHPARPEFFLAPTRLAAWLWERHPALDRPLPEVFAERLTGLDIFTKLYPPAATASCSKVLLVEARWPRHCAPVPTPGACAAPGEYCYANRRADGSYAFTWAR